MTPESQRGSGLSEVQREALLSLFNDLNTLLSEAWVALGCDRTEGTHARDLIDMRDRVMRHWQTLHLRRLDSASVAGGGEAVDDLLREVLLELSGIGCGPCVGSMAPMEDLAGRIDAYLGRGKDKATAYRDRLVTRHMAQFYAATATPAAAPGVMDAMVERFASKYWGSDWGTAHGCHTEGQMNHERANIRDALTAALETPK